MGLLLLLALGVRVWRAVREVVPNPDLIRFIQQAQGLGRDLVGALRAEVYHPLQAALAVGVHGILGRWIADDRAAWMWSFRAVGIVAGAVVTLQIFRLARWLGAPAWAALLAAAAFVLNRRTGTYGSDGLSDMTALALFTESLLQSLAAWRDLFKTPARISARRWALAGALAGLAYLARPEGLAAVVIVTLAMAALVLLPGRPAGTIQLFPRQRPGIGTALRALAVMAAGALVPALPYMAAIGRFTGKKALWGAGDVTPGAADSLASAGAWLWPLARIWQELSETMGWGGWAALLLAAGGAALSRQAWVLGGRVRLRAVVLAWLGVWVVVMYWLQVRAGYLDGRHTLVLMPLLFALLARALLGWQEAARRLGRRWEKAGLATVVALMLLPGVLSLGQASRADKAYLRDAGDWVRSEAPAGAVVCDAEQVVGWVSGHPFERWFGFDATRGLAGDPQLATIDRIAAAHPGMQLLVGLELPAGQRPVEEIGSYRLLRRFPATGPTRYALYGHSAP